MLDRSFLEGYGPVRIIVAYRRRYEKASWKLGIDNDLGACIELLDKRSLCFRVGNDIVIDVVFKLIASFGKILLGLPCGKYVYRMSLGNIVIAKTFYNDGGFLLVYQPGGL